MIEVDRTIISQYGNSPTLTQLIHNMNDYLDPRTDFDNFYDFVWNIETAQGFGLDILGRIVNIGRELTVTNTYDNFGFVEADLEPFGQAPFYNRLNDTTSTYRLSDTAYRKLILVKALSNISASTAPSVNQLLSNLFSDRGKCYVEDLGGMQIRYVFDFLLTPEEFAIITQSGALPTPAGVTATFA